jgi:hypothetical protein
VASRPGSCPAIGWLYAVPRRPAKGADRNRLADIGVDDHQDRIDRSSLPRVTGQCPNALDTRLSFYY